MSAGHRGRRPTVRTLALAAAAAVFLGCPSEDDPPPGDDDAAEAHPEGIAQRVDGWLQGDLHLHTTYSDGYEDVATVLELATYYEHPEFLAAHPEFEGDGLDFLSLTDHRMADQNDDPAFVSDRLILLPGEEFGGDGHAGVWGLSSFVDHDPDGDGTTQADVEAAVADAHAQGALFSPNHPCIEGIPWRWDIRDHDAIEIWNMGWTLASPESTAEGTAEWEQTHGPASPFFRRAIEAQGVTATGQTLVMWEAQLSRGVHPALVGGSDRHAVVLPGTPTTYVRTGIADDQGVLDGIRDRHTFVSRHPAAAQVLLEVERGGLGYEGGDEIPTDAAGEEVTVRVRVGRADGGLLRLIHGSHLATDEELAGATLGTVIVEQALVGEDVEFELPLVVAPGDWLYPLVLEPLVPSWATEEQATLIEQMATSAMQSGDDVAELAVALAPVIDLELLGDPENCDPEDWVPERLQCVLTDTEALGTFFIPDLLDRAMNAWIVDGDITPWCVGALGSAVLFSGP